VIIGGYVVAFPSHVAYALIRRRLARATSESAPDVILTEDDLDGVDLSAALAAA
jgi:hypothetical protein